MNSLFYYAALGLMLGGAVFLLSAGKRIVRRLSAAALPAGFGLLAAGMGNLIVLGLSFPLFCYLVVLIFRDRRSGNITMGGEESESGGSAHDEREIILRAESGSPLRKGIAALLSAGVGGLLLSVVGSNPLWKSRMPSEPALEIPGFGILLLPALLLLLWFFSVRSGSRADQQSDDPE